MAAMRRGSETGLMLTLALVFLVIALVGAGCGIFFFQQYRTVRRAVAQNQESFRESVGAVFTENNWDLPAAAADEMGITYKAESFQQVAAKLNRAAEYQNQVMPTLGWESVGGMQSALEDSPRQREVRAQDEPTYETISGLLTFYEDRYTALNDEVADLRAENEDLSDRLEQTEQSLVETQENTGERLNQAVAEFRSDLEELRADYNELLEESNAQREAAAEWREKYQNELDTRKQMVAELEKEVQTWQDRYWEEVQGPAEREEMQPAGQVISVKSDTDFVYIEGGEDKGFRESDTMVVFGRGPNGEIYKKGVVRVSQVHPITTRASIVEEDQYIIEGDEFVSSEVWSKFHGG